MNPLHKILYWIKESLADISAFFRFGLKGQLSSVWNWFLSHGFELNEWRKSIPKARKAQQQELKDDLARMWVALLNVASAFMSLVWNVFSSPRTAWKQICEAWSRFRSISPKDMIVTLWRSYVAIITSILYFFANLVYRWLALGTTTRILSGILLVGLIAFGASSKLLVDEAKKYRANVLLDEANILTDQEYTIKAYEKLRSAALLNPRDARILDRTMEAARDLQSPEALWWSERKVRFLEKTPESVARVIDYAVDFHDIPVSVKYLALLKAAYPESPYTIDTELKVLMAQGKRNQALKQAREFLDSGKETPLVYELYLSLTNTKLPEIVEEASQVIQENLYREDKIGQFLCERAVFSPESQTIVDQYDYIAIREHLRKFEETENHTIVLATGQAYINQQISRDEAVDTILNLYDLEERDERVNAYVMMNFFGLGNMSEYLLKEGDLKHRDFAQVYLQSLLLSDEPDLERAEALSQINNTETALLESDKHFWEAIIRLVNRDAEGYTLALLQALKGAPKEDWSAMEKLLKQFTAPTQQVVFYREVFGLTDQNPYNSRQYVTLLYTLGEADELQKALPHIDLDHFQDDPRTLTLLIYLKASLGMNLDKCRYLAENMIQEFPEIYSAFISLAYTYYQSGEPKLAKALIKGINQPYQITELSSNERFALAAILEDPSYISDSPARLPTEKQTKQALNKHDGFSESR